MNQQQMRSTNRIRVSQRKLTPCGFTKSELLNPLSCLGTSPHNVARSLLLIVFLLLLGDLVYWTTQTVVYIHLNEWLIIFNLKWKMDFERCKVIITAWRNYVRSETYGKTFMWLPVHCCWKPCLLPKLMKASIPYPKRKSSMCTICICRIPLAPITLASHLVIAFPPKLHGQE